MDALDMATPPLTRGLTPEQMAVVSWAGQLPKRVDGVPGQSAKVLAFAGTGKSHTLGAIPGALQPGMRVLYLAYNTAIAEAARSWPAFMEASRRGVTVEALTIHALAHRHVIQPAAGMREKLQLGQDGKASGKEVHQLLRGEGSNYSQDVVAAAMKALQKFHQSGDDELGVQHIQSYLPAVPALATALLQRMEDPNDTFPITHDAYLSMYCRSRQPLPWLDHDVVLVDEAQDLGAAAERMLKRAELERGCAVIRAGDPHQHLYAFAGACNGLEALATDATLALARNFRNGAYLIAVAEKVLAFKGETVPLRGARGVQTRVACAAAVPPDLGRRNHAVLVRYNATWFKLAVQALDAGHRPYVEDMKTDRLDKLEKLANLPEDARQRCFARAQAENNVAECSLHRLIIEMTPALVLANIYKLRDKCVGKEYATVQFYTVHKAKGLQFEYCELAWDVWDSFLAEHTENAARAAQLPPKKKRHDELHILYTALTRAAHSVELPAELMEMLDEYPR